MKLSVNAMAAVAEGSSFFPTLGFVCLSFVRQLRSGAHTLVVRIERFAVIRGEQCCLRRFVVFLWMWAFA